jgi:hypothetical protein
MGGNTKKPAGVTRTPLVFSEVEDLRKKGQHRKLRREKSRTSR